MEDLNFGLEPIVFEHQKHVLVNYCFNIMFYSLDMSTAEQKKPCCASLTTTCPFMAAA